jgi:hypothetical protein
MMAARKCREIVHPPSRRGIDPCEYVLIDALWASGCGKPRGGESADYQAGFALLFGCVALAIVASTFFHETCRNIAIED